LKKINQLKIQDLLSQYLYQQKKLSLPGIGIFELNPAVNIYELKEEGWPENTVTFTQDRNAQLTDDCLSYLVQNSGKMKPLAMSDLESYLNNGIQLLNIGKPFRLKGIGALSKTGNQFLFEQGIPVVEKLESINPDYVLKDRTKKTEDIPEAIYTNESKAKSRKIIIALGSLIALALIAWVVYLAISKKEDQPIVSNEQQPVVSAPVVTPTVTDTVNTTVDTGKILLPDSLKPTPPPAPATVSGTGFQLIIQTFITKAAADKKLQTLQARGHNVSVQMVDSTNYRLVLTVAKPLSDTTYVKDSLRKWYLWKAELLQ
jgi:hypothetical protein